MTHRGFRTRGFTLIELMIVVAIIGVISSIALPKFANLVVKSKEAAVKGSLGSVRSAITLYYSNTEGLYPASAAFLPGALTTGTKYLRVIPGIAVPTPANHTYTNQVTGTMADLGQWFYSSSQGHLAVACTHTDTRGTRVSTW
jgi:prepilin-type N-terminal cleavage/methylation domain-containing protein